MSRRPTDDREGLVSTTIAGRIAPPRMFAEPQAVDADGRIVMLPGGGGIALGVHVGHAVMDFRADHLMVGASIEDESGEPAVAGPLHQLACLGDRVRDAAGRGIGVVAGKRGGLAPGFIAPQLVSVEAPDTRLRDLQPGDRVILEAIGRGLSLPDHRDISVLNLSPDMLDELSLEDEAGMISVPVRASAPARAIGAGMGQDSWIGDVEIADLTSLAGATDLRFGDLVALHDVDGRVSRFPRRGHVSVGVVSHGPSPVPGHGVGLTLILSGPAEKLRVAHSSAASLAGALRAAGDRVGK